LVHTPHTKMHPGTRELGDCRFYEKKFPDPEEFVMVNVKRIADMGAYVSLLEYNNLEGMILLSELSKRRIRSVTKLIQVGRNEVVMVLRVDKEKGYIDLSKRRVGAEDIEKCEDRFAKSKKVHQTVRHVAEKHKMKVEELNEKVVWPLYKKYGHALDALKDASMNPDEVFQNIDIPDDVKESLVNDIKLRLSPQILKIRGRVDVYCFGYDGIEAVKTALTKARTVGDSKTEIRIKLVAPPQYEIVTSCYDRDEGIKKIKEAMKIIEDAIKTFKGGEFKQQGEILVFGKEEERNLEDEESESEASEGEDGESEEDEGMGLVEEGVPEDLVDEDGDKSEDEG